MLCRLRDAIEAFAAIFPHITAANIPAPVIGCVCPAASLASMTFPFTQEAFGEIGIHPHAFLVILLVTLLLCTNSPTKLSSVDLSDVEFECCRFIPRPMFTRPFFGKNQPYPPKISFLK